MKNRPLQQYHGRRFVLKVAFSTIRSIGGFTQQIRDRIDQLEEDVNFHNRKQYEEERLKCNKT